MAIVSRIAVAERFFEALYLFVLIGVHSWLRGIRRGSGLSGHPFSLWRHLRGRPPGLALGLGQLCEDIPGESSPQA